MDTDSPITCFPTPKEDEDEVEYLPPSRVRDPDPFLLTPPSTPIKSLEEFDRKQQHIQTFFMTQVAYHCTPDDINELGRLLIGHYHTKILQAKATRESPDNEFHEFVFQIFYKWKTIRGSEIGFPELLRAFQKMEHKNLYDRAILYTKLQPLCCEDSMDSLLKRKN